MSDPYIRKDPGDIMLAADWNQMQIQARDEIHKHGHTGGDDGVVLGRAAIAPGAVDGSRIDPKADVAVSSLKVNGRAILDEIDKLAAGISSSGAAKLDKVGGMVSGALTVQGAFTALGGVNFGFTGDDADEWPKLTWYRDPNNKWDEGVVKHSASRGVFGRAGFGIHFHESREWGLWTTGWKPVFAIKGGTGEAKFSSSLSVGGDTAVTGNLTVHGKVVTLGLDGNGGGQLVLTNNTNDNRIYLEAFNTAGNGSAAEMLLTGASAQAVPQLTLKATTTTAAGDLVVGGKLSVTAAIQPSAGNADTAGILFPRDPGGGGGDAAWLRYYARTGEACTLELGISNDADDHIALMPSGNVGINTRDPKRRLHVDNSEIHAGGAAGGISFSSRDSGGGAFVESPSSGERWLWYASGGIARLWSGNDKLSIAANGNLNVQGAVIARHVQSSNPMRHRMYPADPLVYQEIFDAMPGGRIAAGAIRKLGNPTTYDDTSYRAALWYNRHLVKFGGVNEADGNGAEVSIPDGYDTVWIRVLGDRWAAIHAYFLDGAREDLGIWTGGYRSANHYCPDGSLSDGDHDVNIGPEDVAGKPVTAHQWLAIPAGRAGRLALVAKPNTKWDFWISGLAFSRNPWGHATNSAVGYNWRSNGGGEVRWNSAGWNGDVVAELIPGRETELMVPVVPSGRDKLLFLIEHNSNWNGTTHTGISVANTPIERFIASYDNPFARHYGSKTNARYIAARIPAGLIGSGRFMSVKIDLTKQASSIFFREIGSHDLDIPY